MRLRSPIKQRGPATIRWERWREHNRAIVQHRAGYACEACHTNMRPLELAHLVGRGHLIAEPWASCAELTAALCSSGYGVVGCHAAIDRALDLDLQKQLRQKALVMLMLRFGHRFEGISWSDPLDGIREVIRVLEAEGWSWDGQEIVRA